MKAFIRTEGEITYLSITNSTIEAIIDTKNLNKVLQNGKCFHLSGRDNDYIVSYNKKTKTKVALHHVILTKIKGFEVDHINRIKHDCKESNLRYVTNSQNQANRVNDKSNAHSSYKGVSWDKNRKKWTAYITIEGVFLNLGRYKSEITAAKVYNKNAIIFFKEHARLNTIKEQQPI